MTSVQAIQARMAAIEARFVPAAPVALAPGGGQPFDAVLAQAIGAGWASAGPSRAAVGASPVGASAPPAEGRSRWLPAIQQVAAAEGVPVALLDALVWTESGYRPDALSHAGAVGLTQLMPATAAELGVDPADPMANLVGGARYLRQQLDRFGSAELALAAYNAGPGAVTRAGGIPAIPETTNYVATVLSRAGRLQEVDR